MGPVGGQEPHASLPTPDASPAVAFPLSTTRSSSWLGSHPFFHPPTYPTHRPSARLCCRPPPHYTTQPLTPLEAEAASLLAGSRAAGPLRRETVLMQGTLWPLLPSPSLPVDLGWHTVGGDFSQLSCTPRRGSISSFEGEAKKKCRMSEDSCQPFFPSVLTEPGWLNR